MDTDTDLAAELFAVVGRFRRQLRRATGSSFPGVTEAQAELLRLVGRQPGISVGEAAAELGLAPNTASTLVSKLSADGLLTRTADPDDRRVGRLRLTEHAQRIADESRAARRAALRQLLDRLDARQLDDLSEGLAVIAQMTGMLTQEPT